MLAYNDLLNDINNYVSDRDTCDVDYNLRIPNDALGNVHIIEDFAEFDPGEERYYEDNIAMLKEEHQYYLTVLQNILRLGEEGFIELMHQEELFILKI